MLDAQRCLQSRHRRDAMARNIRPRISAPHALYTSQVNVIGIPRIMSHYSRLPRGGVKCPWGCTPGLSTFHYPGSCPLLARPPVSIYG
jgi:hypothetical protein